MKTIAVFLVLAFLVAGCSSDDIGDIPGEPTAGNGPQSAPVATATPANDRSTLTLSSTKETRGPAEQTSGGMVVTVKRLAVADYQEFYGAQTDAGKQALDIYKSQSEGSVTIGQIEIVVENTSSDRLSLHPAQGTIVAGNEQIDVSLAMSDDVGGEFFPGVVKEGRIFFFLKRVPTANITSVTYVISGPFNQSISRVGPEIQFDLPVAAPAR